MSEAPRAHVSNLTSPQTEAEDVLKAVNMLNGSSRAAASTSLRQKQQY